jgi:glycosyltransferase 2 family protein
VSDTDAGDLVPPADGKRRRIRWKALVGLAGIAGLIVAAWSTADASQGSTLPSLGALAGAQVLQVIAMMCAARAWIALFPPGADRRSLAAGLYTSQLTKYLPAGGFVQAASQVAMSSSQGVAAAALRLPVFSLCAVVGAALLGSPLVLDSDQPTWVRIMAALGLTTVVVLDRRVLAAVLRLVRRVVPRVPEPDTLPPQRAILTCFAFAVGNLLAYAGAFALLVGDVADSEPLWAGAAFCAGWWLGYLALPLPSGLGVREAILVGALPGVAASVVLAASVAHRLTGVVAEAALAGRAHLAEALRRRRGHSYDSPSPSAPDDDQDCSSTYERTHPTA